MSTTTYIMYTNIQGLINNYNKLEIIAAEEAPEFFILSEIHITKENEESCYQHHREPEVS